ncbi:MAG: TolC family protein, partial [Porticoccaceae bacterium]
VPLGARQRASGTIATASARKAEAEQRRDGARSQLQAQLVSLYQARQQALAEVDGLRSEVLPPLRQAMTATADAFSQGRYSYLELNLARRELLEAQQALIAAAARAHVLTADLERLTGAPVTP